MHEIICQSADGVLRIELNRPARLNALTATMVEVLTATIDAAAARYGEEHVVVIAGAPPGFCAGADRSALEFLSAATTTDDERLSQLRAANELILALQRFPGPTIAEVGGAAVGGGCNLALACDLVVAADTARFGQVFVSHGLALDMGGSWLLPRLVGMRKATELALLGTVVDAEQALALGLVNTVVTPSALRAVVADQAARLARLPAHALSAIKTQLRTSLALDLASSLELEAQAQNVRLRQLSGHA